MTSHTKSFAKCELNTIEKPNPEKLFSAENQLTSEKFCVEVDVNQRAAASKLCKLHSAQQVYKVDLDKNNPTTAFPQKQL